MPESVFAHTMRALLAGGCCGVFEVFEEGGVALGAVVPLSGVSSALDVLFFFEEAVPESGADCVVEAPASDFSLFLSFLAVLVSLWF